MHNVKYVRIVRQFWHYYMVDHVQAFHYTTHGFLVHSCSEGHQVSASGGQYTNLCDISKLSMELFIPRNQEENDY